MQEFKLIIAGGRDFNDAALLERVLIAMSDTEYADKAISIVSGMAGGADQLGVDFAHKHDVLLYPFPADWNNLTKPGAVLRTNRGGYLYNVNAGFMRNTEMALFSDGLLAFWDGKSNGTKHMIGMMHTLNKPVTVIKY